MPLPEPNSKWPPPGMGGLFEAYARWDAWYTSDRDALARVYGGANNLPSGYSDHPSQYRGGLVGAMARMFWGEPMRTEQRSPKLHVPAAADIASTSAALLFAEEPTLTVDDDATQARLDELLDERFWADLTQAAELCAGLGQVYLRVGWDRDVDDRPLITVIGPDVALPVFRWGRLVEVTFAWALERSSTGDVLRHFELHAPGRIEHALYLGRDDSVGRPVPLDEHSATAGLVAELGDDGAIATQLDGLDVVAVPNMESRQWRHHPVGRHLGQPDIYGVEPLLDAVDESFTSWMRDVRLAKARAVTKQTWLDSLGPGKGATFDMDRELFVGLNVGPNQDLPLQVIQPAIRHAEHAATTSAYLEQAISGAGYSPQTFGLTTEVAMTATESFQRERKTHHTRGSKIRRWRPALAQLAELLLLVDATHLGTRGTVPQRADVEFPPAATDSLESRARSVQMLHGAEAMSTEERVRTVHPDWDGERVAAEVAAIERETAAVEVDPMASFAELAGNAPPAQD